MRNHSGADESSNNSGDPTLKEREGQGVMPSDPAQDAPFDVAADHDQPGGQRSPSARGRGETGSDETTVPDRD